MVLYSHPSKFYAVPTASREKSAAQHAFGTHQDLVCPLFAIILDGERTCMVGAPVP